MGCQAFTPHLVGLAKELENEPFHLIASYNQRGTPAQAKHEIFQNGLHPLTSNVTVSMHANHSGVRGTGYVPYYMVFDHHGDLAHHHQGGPYHGGDGTAVLERVRRMLDQVPVIYTGKDPFEKHQALAKRFAEGKDLNKAMLALAAALKESPKDPELLRILDGAQRYKRREFRRAERLLGFDFKAGRKQVEALAKVFAGTPWDGGTTPLAKAVGSPQAQKSHATAAKAVGEALEKLHKLKLVQGNGGKVLNPLDREFRTVNRKKLDGIIESLAAVRDAGSSTPSSKAAARLLKLLQ